MNGASRPCDSGSPGPRRSPFRNPPCLLFLLLVFGLACRPDPKLPEDVVARLGNHDITVADLQQEARRRGLSANSEAETQQVRQAVLEGLLNEAALFQRAVEAGLDRQPDLQRRFRQLVVQAYRERESSPTGIATSPTTPSESELRRWYEEHAARFTEPGDYRLGLVWIRSSSKAEPARRQAHRATLESARQQIAASANPAATFAEVATRWSEDLATRSRGGDSGWLTRGAPLRWPEEVAAAAGALAQAGDLSPVIEAPNGYYLIRLTDLHPPHLKPFSEVRRVVEHEAGRALSERRANQFAEQARAGLVLTTNPRALAAVSLPLAEPRLSQAPPALPLHQASLPGQP